MQSNYKISSFMLVLGFCYEGISTNLLIIYIYVAICMLSIEFSEVPKCSGNKYFLVIHWISFPDNAFI